MRYRSAIAGFCLVLAYLRCTDSTAYYLNTTITGKKQVRNLVANRALPDNVAIRYRTGIHPRCGTVSHHLLCAPVINEWFRHLSGLRDVKTFIIISPNHNRWGMNTISLSSRPWKTADAITRTDEPMIKRIVQAMGIEEDTTAFYHEHGIESLLPFINHYFPDASLVPILVDEKHKRMGQARRLAGIIEMIMKTDRGTFLLISADFSHRGNRKLTDIHDRQSIRAMNTLGRDRSMPISDNTVGIHLLFRICHSLAIRNNHIFSHTDAQNFSPKNIENITSYIFTYQY